MTVDQADDILFFFAMNITLSSVFYLLKKFDLII